MLKQLSKIRRWDELHALGTNRIVQLTSIVPIFGYFLLFGESFNEYLTLNFGGDAEIGESAPEVSLWRAYWLYYGFCFLAAASLLFSIFCPPPVKSHGAAYDFVDKESNTILPSRESHMSSVVRMAKYANARNPSWPDPEEAERIFSEADNEMRQQNAKAFSQWHKISGSVRSLELNELMTEYFVILKDTRVGARTWISYLYLLGFGAISVPTTWTFLEVAVSAAGAVYSLFVA